MKSFSDGHTGLNQKDAHSASAFESKSSFLFYSLILIPFIQMLIDKNPEAMIDKNGTWEEKGIPPG